VERSVATHRLIKRESEIVELLGEGATNRSIAEELTISIATVETHVKNVRAKLGIRGRAWTRLVYLEPR
jgi:DNA-binding CsgD family transcriptional regulator